MRRNITAFVVLLIGSGVLLSLRSAIGAEADEEQVRVLSAAPRELRQRVYALQMHWTRDNS